MVERGSSRLLLEAGGGKATNRAPVKVPAGRPCAWEADGVFIKPVIGATLATTPLLILHSSAALFGQ